MDRHMVRLFLGGQREGLAQQRQAHQQEDRQCSPGELTVASRPGWPPAKKQGHTDTMVARSDALRLPEILRPSAARHDSLHVPGVHTSIVCFARASNKARL
jgi:hypothetical protein